MSTRSRAAWEAAPDLLKPDEYEILDIPSLSGREGPGGFYRIQGESPCIDIGANAEWRLTLRPTKKGAGYVSLAIYASVGSVLNIDGAIIQIVPSGIEGRAVLNYARPVPSGVEWIELGYDAQVLRFEGAPLVMLLGMTVKTDTETGTWSIYLHNHLMATNLRLCEDRGKARQISVQAGQSGAWLLGLACSDQNPLFVDTNSNDVPDGFEVAELGSLVRRNASIEAKRALVVAYREKQYECVTEVRMRVPPPDPQSLERRGQQNGQPLPGTPAGVILETEGYSR